MTHLDQSARITCMKIGWIGTGVMGISMCSHLGNDVVIYTRTKSKAQPLLDRGATWTDSPRQVARQADIIFTMVGYPADVRQVYFGETGIVAGLTIVPNMVGGLVGGRHLIERTGRQADADGKDHERAAIIGKPLDLGKRNLCQFKHALRR